MAREDAARRELNVLAEALNRFKADVERYPTNEEGLRCLTRKPAAFMVEGDRASSWYGPYIEHLPEVDPWGNDYVYRTEDGGRSFELFSTGPGGEESADNRFRVVSPQPTVDALRYDQSINSADSPFVCLFGRFAGFDLKARSLTPVATRHVVEPYPD